MHLQAPIAERAQRVREAEGLAELSAAEEAVRADDDVHRKYVLRFYNRQWDEPSNYDLVLDTSLVVAVSTMVGRWRRGAGQSGAVETGTTRTDTVWVESLPGLLADPCSGLAAQVDRSAVILPTDGAEP